MDTDFRETVLNGYMYFNIDRIKIIFINETFDDYCEIL